MDEKRKAAKLIIEKLRNKGPAFRQDLEKELGKEALKEDGIPRRTIDYNLDFLVDLKVVEQLDDGRYALNGYDKKKEKMFNAYKRLSRKFFRNPTLGSRLPPSLSLSSAYINLITLHQGMD